MFIISSNGSTSVGGDGNGSSGVPGVVGDNTTHIDEEEWDNIDPLVDNGEPGIKVRALYDYEAAEDDELDFKAGKMQDLSHSQYSFMDLSKKLLSKKQDCNLRLIRTFERDSEHQGVKH